MPLSVVPRFSFVRSAVEAGAAVANYVELVSAERVGDRWVAQLRDVDTGEQLTTSARVIVNAAGPFVDDINEQWGLSTEHRIVYSKGIHLVVPRLTTTRHDRVLAFFDDTQRLFYVIPMGRRSVIGTTDTRIDTPFTAVDDDDRTFLLEQLKGLRSDISGLREDVQGTNARLDQTNLRLDQTNLRLDKVEETLQDLATQMLILARFVRNIAERYDDEIAAIKARLDRLET